MSKPNQALTKRMSRDGSIKYKSPNELPCADTKGYSGGKTAAKGYTGSASPAKVS